jgi:transposase
LPEKPAYTTCQSLAGEKAGLPAGLRAGGGRLVINRDGFAITHEVFAGNTQDRATLATMLDLLAARAGLEEGATVVIDRGMAFDDNIVEIKQRKLHYVVATRQPERDRWLAVRRHRRIYPGAARAFAAQSGSEEDHDRGQDRDGEQTYVLCRSEQRILKDRAIRTKQEDRLRSDIDSLARRIAHRRLVKPNKIDLSILVGSYKEEDHSFDGFIGLGLRCITRRVLPLRPP